jgi:hypothetical protein
MTYIKLKTLANEEYICRAARIIDKAVKLIEAGFKYVCDISHAKIFHKRKALTDLLKGIRYKNTKPT